MSSKMFSVLFVLFLSSFCVSVSTGQSQSCGLEYLSAKIYYSSYLTSPHYPNDYPSSTTCEWVITASSGYRVELSFVTFNTEGSYISGSCSTFSDILEVYDGSYRSSNKLLGKYCKNYLPANVYSSGTSLYLKFKSDGSIEEKGFKIKYRAVTPKPDVTICSPFNTYSQNNNIQLYGSSGYIESPLYGTKYPSNMQCTWIIRVPEGKKIKLTFSDFMVGQDYYCSSYHLTDDQLKIRDGKYSFSTSLKTLCGKRLPYPVYSSGKYLWIRFTSNSNNHNTRNTTGFEAKYEAVKSLHENGDESDDNSEESEDNAGLVVGIVLAVCIFILVGCLRVCIAHSKRTPDHVTVQPPAWTQTTTVQGGMAQNSAAASYRQQTQSGFVPHAPVGYSSLPQSSCPSPQVSHQQPPTGSYPMSTTDGTPQPSAPVNDHPSSTFLDDPPPAYPEVVPDVPPPPYPGISPNPSYVSTT